MKKSEWLAIPNLLSLLRLALIPYFIFYYLKAETQTDYLFASFVILVSGFTDYLDGYIARKYNMITNLGKSLDPFADKVTQLAIVICLIVTWKYMWILVALFVVKELSLVLCNILLYRRGEKMDGSLWYGKVATFTFYGCALFLVAFPMMNPIIANVLMLITGGALMMAFIMYSRWFLVRLKQVNIK